MTGFRLSNEKYEEIKVIVVEMFERYHVSCVPISGFEIASKMGVTVIPYSAYDERIQDLCMKKSEDGFVVEMTNGEFRIFYNDAMGYKRINNTIMHEIAHIILKHTEDSDLAEAEVKFFAKYALAPPVLIRKMKLNDPYEISEVFDISFEAAQYAYGYYYKRKNWGSKYLTSYEKKILDLFEEVV